MIVTFLALFIGGIIGGLCRYLLEAVMPAMHAFPEATLFANLSGSLILGVFYGVAAVRDIPVWFRAGFGTGVIGAYTTFSTFCLDTDTLAHIDPIASYAYVLASVIGGPVFAYIGDILVVAVSKRTYRPAEEM